MPWFYMDVEGNHMMLIWTKVAPSLQGITAPSGHAKKLRFKTSNPLNLHV